MRRFAVRQRPLQPSKRIRVYHLSADGSFISETGERVAANLYDLDDCVSDFSCCQRVCEASLNASPLFPSIGYHARFHYDDSKDSARTPLCSLRLLGGRFQLTRCVVTREGVVLDKGAHLHPEAAHQHASQLRLGGVSLLQAVQRVHQVHSADRRGGGEPSGVQSRLQRRRCFVSPSVMRSCGCSDTSCTARTPPSRSD